MDSTVFTQSQPAAGLGWTPGFGCSFWCFGSAQVLAAELGSAFSSLPLLSHQWPPALSATLQLTMHGRPILAHSSEVRSTAGSLHTEPVWQRSPGGQEAERRKSWEGR